MKIIIINTDYLAMEIHAVHRILEECLEKCKYLQENPKVCLEIGQAGQKRVLKSHNYQDRMMELSDTLKNIYES